MKNVSGTLVVFVLLVTAAFADPLPSAEWTSLFNGTNLDGWEKVNDGTFVATNGVLHIAGGKGWLRTEQGFTNFIFETEWRALETNYNSGVFIRAAADGQPFPTNVWQVNLKDKALGELLQGSQKLVTTVTPPRPVGEWVKLRIEARGRQVVLEVDGARLWEFREFAPERGFIGLQVEGKAFEFRNLRVQILSGDRPESPR